MTADEKLEIDRAREALKSVSDERRIQAFNQQVVLERLHQFIRSEKAYFLPIIDPIDLYQPYFVHPKMSNRRILAQTGAFIIHGLKPPKRMFFPQKIGETEFIVPAGAKRPIRQSLESLGINESTLFPEIDKAADRIKNQYLKR
jgi:hypothetical protein